MATQSKRSGSARTAPDPAAAEPAAQTPAVVTEAPKPAQSRGLNITDLKDMSIQKLTQIAKDLSVAGATGMRKQELIFKVLQAQTEKSGLIFAEGVLE